MRGEKPVITREEFARTLEESGLSNLKEMRNVPGSDGALLAQTLVEEGKLTNYQVEALLARRFDDLVMGNYEILDRLGSGGMGAVFKARHKRMKRIVALKVLSKDVARSDTFLQRFQREVETIARLTHANVVMAYDADEAASGPFLVMEFVDGCDLASEVSKVGPLSVADAVDGILQAARGLEYAHAQGIVHRDIKPANIMRDASGVMKVADLGLARLSETGNQSLTQAGGIVGTVDYMPPEQALDSTAIDHRVDIYSLGCTLYFLLTGKPPFEGSTFMAVLLKHRDAAIPSLSAARPDVPAALDALDKRMMAKKPEERPQTMTEVIRELEELKRTGQLSEVRPAAGPGSADAASTTINYAPGVASPVANSLGLATTVATTPEIHATAQLAGRKIVLAESSRTQAGIVRRYLQQLDITAIHQVSSGREAIEAARREKADAILSSMHLADMTGLELAQLLLADEECSRVGLVLATSEADTAEVAALLPRSARFAIVSKPFDLRVLAEKLTSTMLPGVSSR